MPRLIELCELIVDCEHKTAPTQATGYPSIRTPNIGRGRLILDGVNRVSEETYQAWTQREVPKQGDLILAREAPIGNVAIIPPGLKVCLGQRTVLIRVDPRKLNPQYLMYLVLGDEIQGRISSMSNGATVHHLNMKDIRELVLPAIPDPPVQDRIASILSAYDDLIENNTRRIKILEEMAQMLYREWFVNFHFPGHEKAKMVESELGPIPKGWDAATLGDVLTLEYGKALKEADRLGGSVPVYGSSGVVGHHSDRLTSGPGIIVGRKGNVGSVFYCHSDFWVIDTAYYVRSQLSQYFLYFNLRTQNFLNNDAAVPGLNRNQAHSLPVIVPDAGTLESFGRTMGPIFDLKRCLDTRNANLRTTRDLLLPKLISGEISVEAADEAATELVAESA
jgi:type I restriction enzyme S subunit